MATKFSHYEAVVSDGYNCRQKFHFFFCDSSSKPFDFRIQARLHCPPFFFLFAALPRFMIANHRPWILTCCETSWSFSDNTSSKTKILSPESRTRVYFALLTASTCKTVVCWVRQAGHKLGNTRNKEYQLTVQQSCEVSWRKMLPVLQDLKQWRRGRRLVKTVFIFYLQISLLYRFVECTYLSQNLLKLIA